MKRGRRTLRGPTSPTTAAPVEAGAVAVVDEAPEAVVVQIQHRTIRAVSPISRQINRLPRIILTATSARGITKAAKRPAI